MINILPNRKKNCCGCRACEQSCPVSCFTMTEDDEGFLYPSVDEDACINCGKCERVCPVILDRTREEAADAAEPRAIGGNHADEAQRMDSSSGGAFALFANYVLERGGVVFGCTLDEDQRPVHLGVSRAEDLGRLRGSKYVQSDTADSYQAVRELLRAGREVFYVGSPCQVAGLKSFLGRDYEGLLTCDFICHGVPSPKVFADYLASLEAAHGSKIVGFRFRNKDKPWVSSGLHMGTKIEFADGTSIRKAPGFKDAYMNGFLADLYLRPICHSCPFKKLPKYYADITIGDFWGVDKVCPELNDGKGTSVVLLHNERALSAFEQVKDNFVYKDVSFRDAIKSNPSLLRATPYNPARQKFYRDYERHGFARVERTYMTALYWAAHKIKKVFMGGIRKIAKR